MGGDDALAALVREIRENGYDPKWPILIWNGQILDGRLRAKACEIVGVTPTVESFEGSEAEAVAEWQERHTVTRMVPDDTVVKVILEGRPLEERAASAAAYMEMTGESVEDAAALHNVTLPDIERARRRLDPGPSL